MYLINKILLSVLVSCVTIIRVSSGRAVLNGPAIQTADLKAIDGYVASGLPLFAHTHGFVLHSGMRPVIVKMKDPNKVIRDGIEQPNAGYYRDLPAVIPQGFEGIASTSFLLGNPVPPSKFYSPLSGPVVSFQAPIYREVTPQNKMTGQSLLESQPSPSPQPNAQIAEQSIRVENAVDPEVRAAMSNQLGQNDFRKSWNQVVVQTSQFESNLPNDYKNPFYRNEMLARALAQESLPAPGEAVVDEWNTNKIQTGRVRALLSGAGLI